MLSDGGFAYGADFTFADCALAPTMVFATNMLAFFGAKSVLEGRPKLARWWNQVQTRPSVKKALGEMTEAIAEFRRQQSG